MEFLTDIEERSLDQMVNNYHWQSEQVDRLLGWEVFRAFSTGNWSVAMESTDFCDRIGLNKNYPNVVVDRVRRKIRQDQDG
jgi:hypothetical protein